MNMIWWLKIFHYINLKKEKGQYILGNFVTHHDLYMYKSKYVHIIEVYPLKYYFKSHLIYKWRYYRQTIFNQLNIMLPLLDIIDICHSITILWEIYMMRHKCHVMWLRFYFRDANYGTWSKDFCINSHKIL